MSAVAELEAELMAAAPEVFERSRPWYRTWQQAGKLHDYELAIKLIKDFEGCHLSAYPDPLHGWDVATIGYGTTRYPDGRKVQRGDKITVIDANQLLELEVERIADKLRRTVPYWNEMSDNQRSALVSFSYNVGSGFYGSTGFETITKCLASKNWQSVPAALELYRNPNTSVEAGLLRRRRAEGRLWASKLPRQPEIQQDPAKLTPQSPFSARLTPHVRLGEFALDRPERRFDHLHQVQTAAELAAFLERARAHFGGKPVIITSGYRNPQVNASVGGAKNSEHLFDAPGVGAVDWYIEGVDIYKLQDWCIKTWPYSTGKGATRGFVHTGIRKGKPNVVWDY